jgi:Co/Zn/Cd efflux system component
MSGCCDCPAPKSDDSPQFRKALWVALTLNALMFAVEIVASLRAGSVSLLADAIDFFGDAANYGVSLFALGLGVVAMARASTLKAATMLAFGVWVLVRAADQYLASGMPHFQTMTAVGAVALGVNFTVAVILYRFRSGDSNRQSAWLCTRNDMIGNLAVIAAGFVGQRLTSATPDLLVGVGMAGLTAHSAVHVLRLARAETRVAV